MNEAQCGMNFVLLSFLVVITFFDCVTAHRHAVTYEDDSDDSSSRYDSSSHDTSSDGTVKDCSHAGCVSESNPDDKSIPALALLQFVPQLIPPTVPQISTRQCSSQENNANNGQSTNMDYYKDRNLPYYQSLVNDEKQKSHNVTLSDGFTCSYGSDINQIVACYMDYFSFNHFGGFGCQRSVVDLKAIFDFVKHETGCDLINAPNAKCKNTRKKRKRRLASAYANSDNSGETSDESSKIYLMSDLKITSKPSLVHITYVQHASIPSAFGDDMDQGPQLESIAVGDGPKFPYPKNEERTSFKLTKRGRFNANYTIEINSFDGFGRLVLTLTGKSKLWFRIHCYGCGTWVEVSTNCKEKMIKYNVMSKESIVHIPLDKNNGESEVDECHLWKGGETKKTELREKQYKKKQRKVKQRKIVRKPKTTVVEPKKGFGDWLIPPGLRRVMKKIFQRKAN
ncbi:hypothetical protein Ddc_16515 [Ditylenchus destructor]|nr:hypothetical protein Ddc_16515 [Ditylenchus destructor]